MATTDEIHSYRQCVPHSKISSWRPKSTWIFYFHLFSTANLFPENRMNGHPILNKAIRTQNETISLVHRCFKMKIEIFWEWKKKHKRNRETIVLSCLSIWQKFIIITLERDAVLYALTKHINTFNEQTISAIPQKYRNYCFDAFKTVCQSQCKTNLGSFCNCVALVGKRLWLADTLCATLFFHKLN